MLSNNFEAFGRSDVILYVQLYWLSGTCVCVAF